MAQTTIRSEQLTPSVACSVYLGTTQTDVGETSVQIEYDTEVYDIGGNFNTTTHVFTAPVDGIYLVCAGSRLTGLTDGYKSTIRIRVNGTSLASQSILPASNTSVTHHAVSRQFQLSANDTVDVIESVAGTALGDIVAGEAETWLTIALLGVV